MSEYYEANQFVAVACGLHGIRAVFLQSDVAEFYDPL